MDIGLGMADGCELRVHPTVKTVLRLSVPRDPGGPGATGAFAQIVARSWGRHRGGARRHRPRRIRVKAPTANHVHTRLGVVPAKCTTKAKIIASGHARGFGHFRLLQWEKGKFHVR